MPKILLIDDKRQPDKVQTGKLDSNGKAAYYKPGDVKVARTYEDGLEQLRSHKWDLLLLDHDLGNKDAAGKEKTGYDILCWLEEHSEFIPPGIKLVTANASGGQKMLSCIKKMEDEGKTRYLGWI